MILIIFSCFIFSGGLDRPVEEQELFMAPPGRVAVEIKENKELFTFNKCAGLCRPGGGFILADGYYGMFT